MGIRKILKRLPCPAMIRHHCRTGFTIPWSPPSASLRSPLKRRRRPLCLRYRRGPHSPVHFGESIHRKRQQQLVIRRQPRYTPKVTVSPSSNARTDEDANRLPSRDSPAGAGADTTASDHTDPPNLHLRPFDVHTPRPVDWMLSKRMTYQPSPASSAAGLSHSRSR